MAGEGNGNGRHTSPAVDAEVAFTIDPVARSVRFTVRQPMMIEALELDLSWVDLKQLLSKVLELETGIERELLAGARGGSARDPARPPLIVVPH